MHMGVWFLTLLTLCNPHENVPNHACVTIILDDDRDDKILCDGQEDADDSEENDPQKLVDEIDTVHPA